MKRLELEREFWDRVAGDPEVDKKYISDVSTAECIAALTEELKLGAVLEIGCGVGRLVRALRQIMQTTDFVGLDISQKMIDIAIERSGKNTDIIYMTASGRMIPCNDDVFDSVFSVQTFQHMPSEGVEAYIREAERVLKPGGILYFQYVTDAEPGDFSFAHTNNEIAEYMTTAGFDGILIKPGIVLPNWSWAKGVKQ